MNKLISRYVSEHEHGIVHLTFLRDAIARIMFNGLNNEDLKMAEESILFLSGDLIKHCETEETELYPKLGHLISPEVLLRLSEEHNLINIKLAYFQKALEELKSPDGNLQHLSKVKEESDSFIDLLYTHIKEENNLLNSILMNIKNERKHNENKGIRV